MTLDELRYLLDLVRRDGDHHLQVKHGILHKPDFEKTLASMIETASHDTKHGRAHYFAIFPDISMEIF